MQSQNPYYVEPLGGLDLGKRALEVGTHIKAERKMEALKKKAAPILASGDPDEIARFVFENPEMTEIIDKQIKFKDEVTRKNAIDSAMAILRGEDPEKILEEREKSIIERGGNPSHTQKTLDKVRAAKYGTPIKGLEGQMEDPKATPEGGGDTSFMKQEALQTLALLDPKAYEAYKDALTSGASDPDKRYKVVGGKVVDLMAEGGPSFILDSESNRYQVLGRTLMDTKPPGGGKPEAVAIADPTLSERIVTSNDRIFYVEDNGKLTLLADNTKTDPKSAVGKLAYDLEQGTITKEVYDQAIGNVLNPKKRNKAELTEACLNGDTGACQTMQAMADAEVKATRDKAGAATEGKLDALEKAMDIDGVAERIVAGAETLDKVKNTFGVPIQERVRKKILELDPKYNFNVARASEEGLRASIKKQEQRIGATGSFVQYMNKQIDFVEEKMKQLERLGIRAGDVPWRKLNTAAIGSGEEKSVELILTEISNEATKLSQSAQESIGMLPEEARKQWESFHDINLSLPELKKVLETTRKAANWKFDSLKEERDRSLERIGNVNPKRSDEFAAEDNEVPIPVTGPDDPVFKKLQSGTTVIYTDENGKQRKFRKK